ncbi:MAG: YtxH domain-containing protein [Candidatus Saganbacteria bacterium]|nr:YtxH domain-containing protein [Candidatus Saganbacteria bacterium]
MSEKEDQSSFFFNGLVIGGVVGGVLGLLFAPLKGEEARSKIKEKIEALNIDSDKTVAEIKAKGETFLEQAKQTLLGAVDRIAVAVEEGKKAATEKKSELKKDK